MPITWLHSNLDILNSCMLSSRQFIDNFKSVNAEEEARTYNIICSDSSIAVKLLESFSKLEDAFQDLDLRFGWMDVEKTESVDGMHITKGNTLFIGEGSIIEGFMKIQGVKTLYMTSKAQNSADHLGFQRHLAQHSNPSSIALGQLRADISYAQTLIRRAESLFFHLDVMKRDETGADFCPIAGLDIYQTCNLLRLAGMSRALQLICMNTGSADISSKTSDLLALITWYLLEGHLNKEIENMKQNENDIFLVNTELHEEPIKFVVGHKTGRWWYQLPGTKEYLPCSDKDYQAISSGNLPDAILSLQN